tara:strand:+ start:417 stop:680 length:264 start_codon:yes stop_codon:yes gene_type:complete
MSGWKNIINSVSNIYGNNSKDNNLISLILFRLISMKDARKIIKANLDKSDVVIMFFSNKITPLEVGRFCEVKYPKKIKTQHKYRMIL